METGKIINGDCLEVMKDMEDESIDTILTDPPYGLSFMGQEWDSYSDNEALQKWTKEWSSEALRIAKSGTIMLCFGGTRTFHRIACGIEDAGWEIRDTMMWLYGSGFPKSHNISKAIDKKKGAEREVVGEGKSGDTAMMGGLADDDERGGGFNITAPATKEAKKWQGYGTALKPAYEPIIVAMKPLDGTYAENANGHDVAGLNIDEGRIEYEDTPNPATNPKYRKEQNYKMPEKGQESEGSVKFTSSKNETNTDGRFPTNIIHDGSEEATKRMNGKSRYFYCAKAGKSERNMGLEDFEEVDGEELSGGGGVNTEKEDAYQARKSSRKNTHPTVKPLALMEYLVRLTKMPNEDQVYLDPFTGSGTTAMAVKRQGRNYIGIEKSEEYVEIARARVNSISKKLL